MKTSEAYLDIVWRQFKKNRPALVALWLLAPLGLAAIFAPALASDQPFVYRDAQGTIYPWFRSLFNTSTLVDFIFNMALIGFVPWVVLSLAANWFWKWRGVPGRQRVVRTASMLPAIAAALVVLFSMPSLGLRPRDAYSKRSFSEEQFEKLGDATAIYTPIPFGPLEQDLPSIFQPPGFVKSQSEPWSKINDGTPHYLGTDDSGRDVAARMIYGTRVSLSVGFLAVSIYLAIGIVVGAVAGYFGGMTDILISRVIEIVMLFPSFFLILTLVALLGPSINIIMVVIGITGWPGIARLIRGEVLKQRSMDYVTAARALGASHGRVIFRHILANSLSPALVSAPFGIAGAIMTEAALSLLGFGVRPPTPSWGALLELARDNYAYWWLIIVPSVAIFVTVTLFNLVGSGLRDAMDPRLRR